MLLEVILTDVNDTIGVYEIAQLKETDGDLKGVYDICDDNGFSKGMFSIYNIL